jgi:hypothetical protein
MFRVVCIEYSCILCDELSSRKIANENTYQVEIELAQAASAICAELEIGERV